MAISLVAVGGKITAALTNSIITRANAQGTTGIVPAGVAGTGVSVGTNGVVTFTAATSVSVNGCFTSTYDNYQLEWVLTHSTGTQTQFRLRVSGVDDSSANYDVQVLSGTSTTAAAVQSLATTSWFMGSASATQENQSLTMNSPALSVATQADGVQRASQNPMTTAAALSMRQFQHRSLSGFDGFTLIAAAGTISGTLRIYGMNNN